MPFHLGFDWQWTIACAIQESWQIDLTSINFFKCIFVNENFCIFYMAGNCSWCPNHQYATIGSDDA